MSFLETKFPDIPEDGRIETEPFLKCCEVIVKFFDLLGATVFKPVKDDVSGNINKIKKRLLENPDKFGTLNDIVDTELKETDKALKVRGQGIATNALMWLRRGLQFISLFLSHLLKEDYVTKSNSKNNLGRCATMAYEESLKPYHGWIVGKVFTLAMNAAPYREKLLRDMAGRDDNAEDEKTLEAIKAFSVNFDKNIECIHALFVEKGVEVKYVV